jgi:hypothetical protein
MKRRLTPTEKKRIAYNKDHVELSGESRHGFRRAWPKRKAAAHRRQRRIADAELRLSVVREQVDAVVFNAKRGKPKPKKWGATPLGMYVANRRAHRLSRAGDRVVRRNPRLATQLKALLLLDPGASPQVRRAATVLAAFLRAPAARRKTICRSLYCLFRDCPVWEERAQAWLGPRRLGPVRRGPSPRARVGERRVADEVPWSDPLVEALRAATSDDY